MELIYYCQFIDNIVGVSNGKALALTNSKRIPGLQTLVDFLDLTIQNSNTKLTTATFQKDMNLFLYIPPASAHPRSTILGNLQHY